MAHRSMVTLGNGPGRRVVAQREQGGVELACWGQGTAVLRAAASHAVLFVNYVGRLSVAVAGWESRGSVLCTRVKLANRIPRADIVTNCLVLPVVDPLCCVFACIPQLLLGMSVYGEPKRHSEAVSDVMAALGSGTGTQVNVAVLSLKAVIGKLGKRRSDDLIFDQVEEQDEEQGPPHTPAPASFFDAVADGHSDEPTTPAPVGNTPSTSQVPPGSGPNSGSRQPSGARQSR